MGLVALPEALLIAALCIGAEAALADGLELFVPFWPKGAKIYFIEPDDHASIAGKVIVKFRFILSRGPVCQRRRPGNRRQSLPARGLRAAIGLSVWRRLACRRPPYGPQRQRPQLTTRFATRPSHLAAACRGRYSRAPLSAADVTEN
jgi:hypothetical protein